jgi:hypothetical protein
MVNLWQKWRSIHAMEAMELQQRGTSTERARGSASATSHSHNPDHTRRATFKTFLNYNEMYASLLCGVVGFGAEVMSSTFNKTRNEKNGGFGNNAPANWNAVTTALTVAFGVLSGA